MPDLELKRSRLCARYACALRAYATPTIRRTSLFLFNHTQSLISSPEFVASRTISRIFRQPSWQQKAKTYAREYSRVVTHRSTSPPVTSLSTRERTGSPVFLHLCAYVMDGGKMQNMFAKNMSSRHYRYALNTLSWLSRPTWRLRPKALTTSICATEIGKHLQARGFEGARRATVNSRRRRTPRRGVPAHGQRDWSGRDRQTQKTQVW